MAPIINGVLGYRLEVALTSKIPSSISVFYDSTSLAFGECADYLDVPSLARCVFNEDRTNKI